MIMFIHWSKPEGEANVKINSRATFLLLQGDFLILVVLPR